MNVLLLLIAYVLGRVARIDLNDRFDRVAEKGLTRLAHILPGSFAGGLLLLLFVALLPLALGFGLLLLAAVAEGALAHALAFCLLCVVLGSESIRLSYERLEQRANPPEIQKRLPDLVLDTLQRYFVIAFWFVLGGAPLALLLRLLQVAERKATRERLKGGWPVLSAVSQVLEWVPLRTAALLVALPSRVGALFVSGSAGTLVWFGDRLTLCRALSRTQPGMDSRQVLAGVRRRLGLAFLIWIPVLGALDFFLR